MENKIVSGTRVPIKIKHHPACKLPNVEFFKSVVQQKSGNFAVVQCAYCMTCESGAFGHPKAMIVEPPVGTP